MRNQRLYRVALDEAQGPQGRTRHYKGNVLPPPKSLEIVRSSGQPGVFLYYLDSADEPQTDTWHISLDDAFGQARFEFGVEREEWTAVEG